MAGRSMADMRGWLKSILRPVIRGPGSHWAVDFPSDLRSWVVLFLPHRSRVVAPMATVRLSWHVISLS